MNDGPRNEPTHAFADHDAFEQWLGENGATASAIWLRIAKGSARGTTIEYEQAIEAALCFGWIDGQKRGGDDEHWLQRFSRRTPRSKWSQINRERAERLIAEGRMQPAGLAEVERARADGRWDAAYAGQRSAKVPSDLQEALDGDPALAEAFAALDGANRYAIIWRLQDAKRPETRARRLAKYIAMLRRGERIHG